MAYKKPFRAGPRKKRRRSFQPRETRDQNSTYFENAVVTETLPGTLFKVKVEMATPTKRPPITSTSGNANVSESENNLTKNSNLNNTSNDLEKPNIPAIEAEVKSVSIKEKSPILIICKLKTKLIKRKVMVVKGDRVVVEVNPEDMYFNEEMTHLKGIIIERK